MCDKENITLIHIPYWWDRSKVNSWTFKYQKKLKLKKIRILKN